MTTEWQAHGGAVNTTTTPKVQYAYCEMASGANHSRLTAMTYPSGYVLTYNYSSRAEQHDQPAVVAVRLDAARWRAYNYLGLGTVVMRGHPQPGVDLTYIKRRRATGDAGDQYTGLDRFGRVVDQNWDDRAGTAPDRFQYGYDRDGNRLSGTTWSTRRSASCTRYDGLNQLASFDRGTLNGGKTGLTGSASRSQDWDYDALGNWDALTTGGRDPDPDAQRPERDHRGQRSNDADLRRQREHDHGRDRQVSSSTMPGTGWWR